VHVKYSYRHVGIGRFPVDENAVSQDLGNDSRVMSFFAP
jgi:hypothetical protein